MLQVWDSKLLAIPLFWSLSLQGPVMNEKPKIISISK